MQKTAALLMNLCGLTSAYGTLRNHCAPRAVVLMYHRVGPHQDPWSLDPVSAADFERQVRYLSRYHTVITLEQLAGWLRGEMQLPSRAAVITFDDGYKDVFTYAYPVLKKYRTPATVFLPTAYIGGSTLLWWDRVGYAVWKAEAKRLVSQEFGSLSLDSARNKLRSTSLIVGAVRRLPDEEGASAVDKLIEISGARIPVEVATRTMLSWDEVEEMSNNGIEFGAHTHNHRKLAGLSVEETRYEITRSKNEIEERLGKRVTSFAYPYGLPSDFDSASVDIVRESGFQCGVATIRGMVSCGTDAYRLGRVGPGSNLDMFKVSLSGLHADAMSLLSRGS